MASDINRVILKGRLTKDPELKSTSKGTYFCRFTLASNRSVYNRQTNESKDEVGFFDCTAWGKPAEILNRFVKKGQRLIVEGHLNWSAWEGQDGKKHSKVDVTVEQFNFLEAKGEGGSPEGGTGSAAHYDEGGMNGDDDIPF